MDFSLLGFHGLRELFNVHPAFVHFPICLFPLSLLWYLLSVKVQKEGFRLTAHLTLLLATLSAVITAITGLLAEDSIPHNKIIHHMMETHEMMAYIIVAAGIILSLWSFIRRDGKPRFFSAFMAILAFVCLSILLNADLGARMVFVQGAGVKVAKPLIEGDHEHHHDHEDNNGKNP